MANEIARRKKVLPDKGGAVANAKAGPAPNKLAQTLKHAVEKHKAKVVKRGTKKLAKKATKTEPRKAGRRRAVYAADYGLMTAFHHMQRASVVMSLMEEGTGEDLRALLERGVKLYRKAVGEGAGNKFTLRAIGVLRAAEHLSMAGLYSARDEHRKRVVSPTPKWLTKVLAETERRLEQIEHEERGKGADLLPVTIELVRQAEAADYDAHLAFELAMAADALCFALENGL